MMINHRERSAYWLLSGTTKLDTEVLRTHTSAHQSTFISGGKSAFICTGDVYRRDEIDASHYPVFHQMEGVRIFQDNELPAGDIYHYAMFRADV